MHIIQPKRIRLARIRSTWCGFWSDIPVVPCHGVSKMILCSGSSSACIFPFRDRDGSRVENAVEENTLNALQARVLVHENAALIAKNYSSAFNGNRHMTNQNTLVLGPRYTAYFLPCSVHVFTFISGHQPHQPRWTTPFYGNYGTP